MSHDPMADIPDRYRGVWVRTLLETPQRRDDSSDVRWLQTGQCHADLRVPAGLVRPTHPLEQCTPEQQAALALQQGFCGITAVETDAAEEVCTWHRALDFHPPGVDADAGHMVFETSERVIETGVHGVYREVWERLPGSTGRSLVLTQGTGPAARRLLVAGRYLMRVRPRVVAWPAGTVQGDTLAQVLRRCPDAAAALLDFEISFGVIDAGHWRIERSTLPALEGQRLPCVLTHIDAQQAQVRLGEAASPWDVVEWREASG